MDARTTEFAVAEAKARFSELIARAEAGEEIVIKRHGRPVARLAPATRPILPDDRADAWERWFAYSDSNAIRLGDDVALCDLLQDTRGD